MTITLNPALDRSTSVAKVDVGSKLRCAAPNTDVGGGGVNVSRVIAELGGTSKAFVALGGQTGQHYQDLLRTQLSNIEVFQVSGDTRQSLSVVDSNSNEQYRFIMPGPTWTTDKVADVMRELEAVCDAGSLVVFSGSLPPGVPDSFASSLSHMLSNCDLIFDVSGAALSHLAKAESNAFLLRMDRDEGEMLSGRSLANAQDTALFAQSLLDKGAARAIIIARGAEGSVLVTTSGAWSVMAADVAVNSKTGAGDSFVGALAFELANGQPLETAIQLGAAAASATVTTAATDLCQAETVQQLLPQCIVTRLEL